MITLATLEQATEQEVFNQGVDHLLTQDRRSESKTGFCKYLNDNGDKCAGGCFIGADEYNPEMEGSGWHSLVIRRLVPGRHEMIIRRLQAIHDRQPVITWPRYLMELAKERGLTWPAKWNIYVRLGEETE